MPSGKSINWSQYDAVLIAHLSSFTIKDFGDKYLPGICYRAIGARARKLGIQQARYKPTDKHKTKIAVALSKATPELVDKLRELRDSLPIRNLAVKLGISRNTICALAKKNHICLSELGRRRAREASTKGSFGRIPWNKNGRLSADTKRKISVSVKGENNGWFGHVMTDGEKASRRSVYFSSGIFKMRAYLASSAGMLARRRSIVKLRSSELRLRASKASAELSKQGKIGHRGYGEHLNTNKGGEFSTKSTYETKYVAMLEEDANVVAFRYEPFGIEYEFGGVRLFYIPDFLVSYADDHEELVEVKPARMVAWPKNQAKFKAASNKHECFKVITESELLF